MTELDSLFMPLVWCDMCLYMYQLTFLHGSKQFANVYVSFTLCLSLNTSFDKHASHYLAVFVLLS